MVLHKIILLILFLTSFVQGQTAPAIKIFLLVAFFGLNSCKPQKIKGSNTTNKSEAMKTFDIKKYSSLKIDSTVDVNGNDKVYLNKNKRIEISYSDKGTRIVEKDIDSSHYKNINVYFKNNKLHTTGKRFYRIKIGISREYNEKGILVEEKNWDENYKFSLDDFIKKVKNEYNIDLLNDKRILDVDRGFIDQDIKRPFYVFHRKNHTESMQFWSYLFDGNSGELLYKKSEYMGEAKVSILDQYLNSLKTKK
jgi:hypothetical protein